MFEIKISKAFEDKTKFNDFKKIIMSFPKKNRENLSDVWHLKFEKNEDFIGCVIQIASKIGEYKMTDYIFSYCYSQQMNYDEASKFADAFYLYFSEFIAYSLNTSIVNMVFYTEFNNVLNVESFLRFNMKGLEKELAEKLENPDALAGILGLSESNVLDKLGFIDMFSNAVQIMEENNCEIEQFKDFKIYKEGQKLVCVADDKVNIDRKYFSDKYNIVIEPDSDDFEALSLIISLLIPNRIIFFASLTEEEKKYIAELVTSLKELTGDIKIMKSDELKPR